MIDLLLILTFALSAILIVYHHVGYPVILSWYSKSHPLKAMRHKLRGFRTDLSDQSCASVTILVPAYNEEQWIADKIRNLASLDYPRKKLKVIIACDGCTDNTVLIAEQTIQEAFCCDVHFEIRALTPNRGKVAVVNEQMKTIDSDITALSDVSAIISLDALWLANKHFKKPDVGVVNGRYTLFDTRNTGESNYWLYQSNVKMHEATLGSTLGAHGAFYLFRTELFEPLASNTINDDFIIPMRIVRKGYLSEYDKEMTALELEPSSTNADFKRRLRISAGNMQQAIRLSDMFLPRYRGVAFAFLSGKGLRLLTPYLMIACLITSICLSQYLVFMAALVTQLVIYCIAYLAYLFPYMFSHKICKLLLYVVAGHIANFIGGLRYLLGLETGRWSRVNH
ncbi:glycosyltransferase family 2 protein [Vibrio atypicus]|uniref:glycosyltransferase family 2 protein n=1 Tax=Vibrio atypicus TaxID=558271 RepID=UPI003736B44F